MRFPGTNKISQDGILLFGKYKGKHIAAILNLDPGWVRWAMQSGALSSKDLDARTAATVDGKIEEQLAHEDELAEFWGDTGTGFSTSRKVYDHGT